MDISHLIKCLSYYSEYCNIITETMEHIRQKEWQKSLKIFKKTQAGPGGPACEKLSEAEGMG